MTTHTRAPHLPRQHRTTNVPNTPEAREHAQEAEDFREDLRALGVDFEQLVPTGDGRGHARLNFTQLGALLDLIDEREERIEALTREVIELRQQKLTEKD